MASTITLQTVVNLASTHAELLPLSGVGGFSNEPALSICNDALAEIINSDHDWKWNRVEMATDLSLQAGTALPLFTMPNIQDYYFAGASAFCLSTTTGGTQFNSSGVSVDLASNSAVTVSGGVVTVNTLQPHQFVVGATVYLIGLVAKSGNTATPANYNAGYTNNGKTVAWSGGQVITAITASSFSFAAVSGQNNGDILGAPGITDFGWLSGAQLQELNNNSSPPNIRQLKARRELPRWNKVSDAEFVSVLKDLGTGVLLIRFYFIPGTVIWIVNLIYQKQAPVLASLTSTWAPIPDFYASMTRQAVLYRMYRYINSPKAEAEYTKLQAEIAKQKGSDEAEESDVYLEPEESLIDYGPYWIG